MKNKKSIMAIMIAILVVIGVTIAYFTSLVSFDNEFITATYKTTTTEEFTGPTNWTPGEEIPKTVTTTNEGSIKVAVRVSYTENWKDKNGEDLNPQPENKVTINLDHTNDWTKEGNYYYYNYPLDPTKTTSSFMKSVTLNSDAIGSDSTTCTTSQDGKSKTCEAVDDLAGATYTLTLTIETVQYDAYKTVWNTNVTIEPKRMATFINRQNENQITVGDLVRIGDTEEFYVVSSDETKTVLLTHYNLNVGNNKNPNVTEGIQHSTILGNKNGYTKYGNVIFSSTPYWENQVGEGMEYPGSYSGPDYPYVYDENSSLLTYMTNYKNYLEGQDVEIEKIRLLSAEEAISFGCNTSTSCSSAPSWLYETTYWIGNATSVSGILYIGANSVFTSEDYACRYFRENQGLRPVIEMSTSNLK